MFYLYHKKFDGVRCHERSNHVSPLLYHPALIWDRPSRATVSFSEESVLFPLCTVWTSVERVCSLCFSDSAATKKETHPVDMPLRTKRTTRSNKSILRKSKRTRRRTRRVRFLGGMVGPKWVDTPLGPMTESAKKHYDEQRHAY
jgi:hypothetical protein